MKCYFLHDINSSSYKYHRVIWIENQSHKNAFPHNVQLKRELIQTILEMIPTYNLIRYLCYFFFIDFNIIISSISNSCKIFFKINWAYRPLGPLDTYICNTT